MGKEKEITPLHPTQDEQDYWAEQIKPIFERRFGKDNQDKVDEAVLDVIEKAKAGFANAPKTFSGRVRMLSKDFGVQGRAKKQQKKAKKTKKVQKDARRDTMLARREREVAEFMKLYEGYTKELSKLDRDYFKERINYYMREIRLNMSSDLPLLLQLITLELTHRKLMVQMAEADETNLKALSDITKVLNLATENMSDVQKTLGISRQQRQKAMGGSEGSVAEISITLEDKKKKIAQIEREEREQEELLLEAKMSTGDLNEIPSDPAELRQILNNAEAIEA